jgi:hypothetical protein
MMASAINCLRGPCVKCFLLLAFLISAVCGCQKQDVAADKLDKDVAVEACTHGLLVIHQAKNLWAEKNQKTTNDTPTAEDLARFVRRMPTCPSGGTYTLGRVGELPACSISEHNEAFKKMFSNP